MDNSRINIVVAFHKEAQGLIKKLRLKKLIGDYAFEIFRDKDEKVHLIVSGMGRVNSAIATTYLHCHTGMDKDAVFVNLGICGGDGEVGELVRGNKVVDDAVGKSYYPANIVGSKVRGVTIATVDSPRKEVIEGEVVDMEAAGFMQAVLKFTTIERVVILKVISDNEQEGYDRCDPKEFGKLMDDKVDEVVSFIEMVAAV